eukprot:scpid62465/ scgid32908/ 
MLADVDTPSLPTAAVSSAKAPAGSSRSVPELNKRQYLCNDVAGARPRHLRASIMPVSQRNQAVSPDLDLSRLRHSHMNAGARRITMSSCIYSPQHTLNLCLMEIVGLCETQS